ncbi:hypothetical protein M5E06_17635 [Azospirillum sp. A1-3]|uniref:hypothetical protein n=1 Tax=Azospirillum sp. A1-3 TaxID=185874 RepID=UPI002076DD98|nr:hypothetical protein [Azospirillum sp. A1-3]MCM8735957.1 hypothetical protein [Azospirillum sp. A1-3]
MPEQHITLQAYRASGVSVTDADGWRSYLSGGDPRHFWTAIGFQAVLGLVALHVATGRAAEEGLTFIGAALAIMAVASVLGIAAVYLLMGIARFAHAAALTVWGL